MSKDHITDYATAAFRFWATAGGLDNWSAGKEDELMELAAMRRDGESVGLINKEWSDPTAAAFLWAKGELTQNDTLTQLLDLQAVGRTIESVRLLPDGRSRIKAIERVYMLDADRPLEKGDITGRVAAASIWIPAGERTVWRWLKDSCIIFSRERGMRLEDWQHERLKKMRTR